MQTFEFTTHVKDGTIQIPPDHAKEFTGNVRVILMSPPTEAKTKEHDIIEELMDNPVKVKGFKPMTREEIYDR